MSERVLGLLPEYVLGGLQPQEIAEVDAALTESATLRAELRDLQEDLTGLAVALTPVAPSPGVRSRLLASVKAEQFAPFVDELAEFCDLAVGKMRAVLSKVSDAAAWGDEVLPGLHIIHFDHGPACFGVDTGLIRLAPDTAFPKHKHLGREVNYVISGALIDEDGAVYGPGTYLERAKDDTHTIRASSDGLTMIAIHCGMEMIFD